MAVSVTVSASKLDVTSTGGVQETLDAVYTAVGDAAVMSRTGSGPYVYTIHRAAGSLYREFEVSSGCKLLFEQNDTLNIEGITNTGTYATLDFAAGCEIEIEDGFTIDLNSDGQTYARSYIYVYGKLTMTGTSGNPITIKKYRSYYDYARADQNWSYVVFQDTTYSAGYMYYFSPLAYTNPEIERNLDNVTIKNTSNQWGRVYFTYFTRPMINCNWTNWTFDNIDDLYFYMGAGKFTGWTFTRNNSQVIVRGGSTSGIPYDTSKTPMYSQKVLQAYPMFEDCTFRGTDTSYCLYVDYGAVAYFKNCVFENETYGIYCAYGAIMLEYGDSNQFNFVTTNRRWAANGTYLRCRELDITVQDKDGNPLENATVSLMQLPDYKEYHTGSTNSDGKLLTVLGEKPIVVEREETSTGSFENWSNDFSGGTAYHAIHVAKIGYGYKYELFEATEDRTFVITLYPAESHPTSILNSTLYDTVLY